VDGLPVILDEVEAAKELKTNNVYVASVLVPTGEIKPIGQSSKGRLLFTAREVERVKLRRANVKRYREVEEPLLAQRQLL